MFMRRANVLVGRRGGIRRRAMPLLFLQGYCWFFIFLWVQQGVTLLRFQLKTTCRASRLWAVRVRMLECWREGGQYSIGICLDGGSWGIPLTWIRSFLGGALRG